MRLRGGEWTDADLAGTGTLLNDFIALASADPEQMAAFMARYGILELCGEHGRPDRHDHGDICPLLAVDDYREGVEVRTVRRAARAFADLRQRGQAVRVGLKPPAGSGADTEMLMPSSGFRSGRKGSRDKVVTDRERIAQLLTRLNRETGVGPLVTWDKRLSVTFAAGGLLGFLAILLTREIAARDGLTYTCSVCGVPVARGRPPQPDEAIYCTKESCKREQRRRNQAAWRARKRAEGKS